MAGQIIVASAFIKKQKKNENKKLLNPKNQENLINDFFMVAKYLFPQTQSTPLR